MKMPRRYFFPMEPPPDIFGLRSLTLIGEACETESERKRRAAKIEAGVGAAFTAATRHLGEAEARELFRRVIRKPKRGRGKELAPDRDFRLLAARDEAVARGESVAALARRLRASGIGLGNTEGAIARRIHQLVSERDERQHKAAVEARYWRMATRHEPPTLLEMALSEK
jgi:hypothetical protein